MVRVSLRGRSLLNTPEYNKGTAFSAQERKDFGLQGLLPQGVQTLEEQVHRAYEQYCSCSDALAKNIFMSSMASQNIVLYHALLKAHLEEMFSVIYTPTEGEAIERYSQQFRKPEGCFLHIGDTQQDLEVSMKNAAENKNVRYIVVSDGEQILGLGDEGTGGVLISVAKLVLATALGGIEPSATLPVVLDVGTERKELLDDPLYLGTRQRRVRGEKYDDLIDAFVKTATKLFPYAFIHFEDFGVSNARRILDRYRTDILVFNDDVQGTGCVTFAAILAALHISKIPLREMKVVVFGSGSAGCGIAQQIAIGMAVECDISFDKACRQIWCIDKEGLITEELGEKISIAQRPFARPKGEWAAKDNKSLEEVIRETEPHVLIGTSTKHGSFTEGAIKEMAKHVERPIILPLSNPAPRLVEAMPSDIIKWTDGKALIATGSPFDPVTYKGTKYEIAECNNSCCFPGIGLGCVLSRASRLTDEMLMEAVKAMAGTAPGYHDPTKGLVPSVGEARKVSEAIALAVIKQAKGQGVNNAKDVPEEENQLKAWIKGQMWEPVYQPYEKA